MGTPCYAKEFATLAGRSPDEALFPEALLQQRIEKVSASSASGRTTISTASATSASCACSMTEKGMSATGRSPVRLNQDVYPTPGYCVDKLLPWLDLNGRNGQPLTFFEPRRGEGAISDSRRRQGGATASKKIHGRRA
jgi:hypothetical protein